jgi:hypothetical protein
MAKIETVTDGRRTRREPDPELEKLEKEQSEMDDSAQLPPTDIVSYNELRSCADIYRMYEMGQLIIPEFQRNEIWTNPAKTRFIDSLIKQLPIPSMCRSLDHTTDERLIIDGLQRISTIRDFLNIKKEYKLSVLSDIDEKISGKTNIQIYEKHRKLYERVQNTTLPITVIRCDKSNKNHMKYLFTIFHRLNTGGVKLTNQEIRNCMYHGKFNNLLKNLVEERYYRDIYKVDTEKIDRFAHEEMALRFIAFSETYEEYKGKLGLYLNEFMDSKKEISDDKIEDIKKEFIQIHKIIKDKISLPDNYSNFSKAIKEALYVGIQRNFNSCLDRQSEELNAAFNNLLNDPLFSTDSLKASLSNREKVIARLARAIEIFN